MTAQELLASLRPGIAVIIDNCRLMFPDRISTCESQSLPALQALDALRDLSEMCRVMGQSGLNPDRIAQLLMRDQLRDFLAVHRTVQLLQFHEACEVKQAATEEP